MSLVGTVFNPLQKEREWGWGGGHEPQGYVKEEKQVPATHWVSEEKEKLPGTGWLAGLSRKDVRKQRVPGNQGKGRPDIVGWEGGSCPDGLLGAQKVGECAEETGRAPGRAEGGRPHNPADLPKKARECFRPSW